MGKLTQEQIERAVSLIHDVRYGGLPTHFPSLVAWENSPLRRERQIAAWKESLEANPDRELGIYLNIPFCKKKCAFCFLDVKGDSEYGEQQKYISALEEEMSFFAPLFKNRKISSVYIGGGTPNFLPADLLERLLNSLHKFYDIRPGTQISMESNPDFFTEEKMSVLADGGVTMLLMGIQSFSPRINGENGRAQDTTKIKNAFAMARAAGIRHINSDLLCGLKGQTKKNFIKDIMMLAALRPTQIHLNRIKPLSGTLPPETKAELSQWQKSGLELLRRLGYEILDEESACLNGMRNRQGNYFFHLDGSLLGMGAGSLSHAWGKLRYRNIVRPSDYTEKSLSGGHFSELYYEIGIKEELLHYLMNTLLHGEDVSLRQAEERFGAEGCEIYRNLAEKMEYDGFLEKTENGWQCPLRMDDWLGVTAAIYGEDILSEIVRKNRLSFI